MKNPVATRILNCTIGGRTEEVTVSIGWPQEDGLSFRCEYEIGFANRTQLHAICGVDGIHAIQLAMFMIGSTLSSLTGASNWTWNGEPNTGFPKSLDEPIIGLSN
jgi:uncharacterized protein DUF6968